MRRNRALANVLLGAGAYLLETMRERMSDNMDDWRDRADDLRGRARDTYGIASRRVSRATDALRGEDSNFLGNATALIVGVGIGVGVGILLAPASGEETRRNISDKVQEFGDKVRTRAREVSDDMATGTYGQ
jgi:ElaB/YqjD/DUF883 family membrane-anchored ribosome-binding protein